MTYVQVVEWHWGYADNAFLAELLNAIAQTGKPYIKINASVYNLFTFLADSPEKVLGRELTGPSPSVINQFKKHTYFILYPLAPLTFLVQDKILIPVLKVVSFMGLVLCFGQTLRKGGIGIGSTLVMIFFLTAHPNWSHAIYGQMYVDRLFLTLGFLFLSVLGDSSRGKWTLVLLLFLCAAVNDRIGAICGVAILVIVLLYPRTRNKRFLILSSLLAILGSVAIIKLYLDNHDYASFSSSLNMRNFLNSYSGNPLFRSQLHDFLLVNVMIFGAIAIFDWRSFLLALGVMLPNIVGTIGGAEKVGWSTHYHSLYFPFLAWALCNGYMRAYRWSREHFPNSWCYYLNAVVLVLSFVVLNFYPAQYSTKNPLSNHALLRPFYELSRYLGQGDRFQAVLSAQEFEEQIPEGVVISTVEPLFTRLYRNREIHIYPAGLDIADYVVVPFGSENQPRYVGAASYQPPDQQTVLNTGLNERMKELGFDLDSPYVIHGFAVLWKKLRT